MGNKRQEELLALTLLVGLGSACSSASERAVSRASLPLLGALLESAEPEGSRAAAWEDWDGDGDLDLAATATGRDAAAVIYENQNGFLVEAWLAPDDLADPRAVAWGDIDGDGRPDLLVTEFATTQTPIGDALYCSGGGSGGLERCWTSDRGDRSTAAAFGDLDGDRDLDLAIGTDGAGLRLFENVGGELAATPSRTVPCGAITDLAFGALDDDGGATLAVATEGGAFLVLAGTAALAPSTPAPTSFDERALGALTWGDWDADGDLDLLVVEGERPDGSVGGDLVFENTGGQLAQTPAGHSTFSTNPPLRGRTAAWSDTDGDGDLDLATGGLDEGLVLYRNDPPGGAANRGFTWVETRPLGTVHDVAWGDLDGDGLPELATAGAVDPEAQDAGPPSGLRVFGSGVDPLISDLELEAGQRSVAWADLDGDGYPDLATVGGVEDEDPVRVYRGGPQGLIPTPAWSSDPRGDDHVARWGDIDGDGDPDLLVGYESGLDLFRNEGGGLTGPEAWPVPETPIYDLALADVDDDGDLDVALARYLEGVEVWLNGGAGLSLTRGFVATTPSVRVRTVTWGDVDGDGDLDLAATFEGDDALGALYRNDAGALTAGSTWTGPEDVYTAAWADWDGDGDLDIAVGGYSDPVRVFANLGAGLLSETPAWASHIPPGCEGLAWGDYDGDGDPDLATGHEGDVTRLYRNDGGELNLIWSSPAGDSADDLAWADVDGDGDLDLAVGGDWYAARVYRNPRLGGARLASNPTTLRLHDLGVGVADTRATGTAPRLVGLKLPVRFSAVDPESDPVLGLRLQFSTVGGGSWQDASVFIGPEPGLRAGPAPGVEGEIVWDAGADAVFSDSVMLRLSVASQASTSVTGPLQVGATAITSGLLRVRGARCWPTDIDGDGDGVSCGEDCDDADDAVGAAVAESCDGLDTDCDGYLPTEEVDNDGDGVSACEGDCDDADPLVRSGRTEATCADGLDDDCDGSETDVWDDPDCWTPVGCSVASPHTRPLGLFAFLGLTLLLGPRRRRLTALAFTAVLLALPVVARAASTVLELEPDRSRAALAAGDCAEAERAARRVIEHHAELPLGWRLLGDALRCSGDRQREALASYRRYEALGGGDFQVQQAADAIARTLGAVTIRLADGGRASPLVAWASLGEERFEGEPQPDGSIRLAGLPIGEALVLRVAGLGLQTVTQTVEPLGSGEDRALTVAGTFVGTAEVRVTDAVLDGRVTVLDDVGPRPARPGARVPVTAGTVRVEVETAQGRSELLLELADGEVRAFDPADHLPTQLTIVGLPAGSEVRVFVESDAGGDAMTTLVVPSDVWTIDPETGARIAPPQVLGSLQGGLGGLFVSHPILGGSAGSVVLVGGDRNATTFDFRAMDGVPALQARYDSWRSARRRAAVGAPRTVALGVITGLFAGSAGLLLSLASAADRAAADEIGRGVTAAALGTCAGGAGDCTALGEAWNAKLGAERRARDLRVTGGIGATLTGIGFGFTVFSLAENRRAVRTVGPWDPDGAPR